MDDLNEIRKQMEVWEEENADAFKGERKNDFRCECGIPLKRVYTPLDIEEEGIEYLRDIGFPGEYPYTRGISPIMYRGKAWTNLSAAGRSTPQESNKLWKALMDAGARSILVTFDLPTHLGYDPDNPLSEGEVGRVGVSMSSQRDWETGFDGIDLGKVDVSQALTSAAVVGVANYVCLAAKQGVDLTKVHGHCQNDVLEDYLARGTYILPTAQALRISVDIMSYCSRHLPNYQPLSVVTQRIAENGVDVVREAALGLACCFGHVQAAVDRGIDVDAIAPGILLVLDSKPNFFEQIAKHRAVRRIYAKVMKDRFKAKKPRSLMAWIGGGMAGSGLYREQYLNNIARTTVARLAAVLGGAQWTGASAYDEGYGIPTEEATLTTFQTGQVLACETGVTDVVDPLAGSYFVESLTSEIEEKVLAEMDSIDKMGGIVQGINSGQLRRSMSEDAYRWQKAFESGEILRVGVNCFKTREEKRPTRVYRCNPEIERQRVEEVRELKRKRDNSRVRKALGDVKALALLDATSDNNLVPPIIEAVKAYATGGEIFDALRETWGEYREPGAV